jgi:hypothetical protein
LIAAAGEVLEEGLLAQLAKVIRQIVLAVT